MIRSIRSFLPVNSVFIPFSEHLPTKGPKNIVILGSQSVGKSTLVNALLGGEIIPLSDEFRDLSTDTLTEIKYGDSQKAVIHYRDPLPQNLRSAIPEAAKAAIETAAGSPINAHEVLPYQTWDYVMAPDARDECYKPSPFHKLELFLPHEPLASGITFIDTKGFDIYSNELDAPTVEAIDHADLLVNILDGATLSWDLFDQKHGMSDNVLIDGKLAFLRKHLPEHSRVCFVLNLNDETLSYSKHALRAYLAGKTIGPFHCGAEHIFCVDALLALTASLEHDIRGRWLSGLTGLERLIQRLPRASTKRSDTIERIYE